MFRRELPRAVMLAALFLALLPGVALAAPAWLDPETIDGSGSESGAPDVAAFGEGEAAVVWARFVSATENAHVYASVRPRGGPWGSAEDLEPGGGVEPGDVRVVARPDGELIAVWRGLSVAGRWARRPPGGPWTDPGDLPTPCCEVLEDLVAGADGSVTVLWTSTDGSPLSSTMPAGSGTWEPSETLTAVAKPSLAAAPDGSVAVAWTEPCAQGECVQAAFKPPGQGWGGTELVSSTPGSVTGVALAARPDSGFTAVWTEGGPPGAVRANDRTAGERGAWDTDPQPIADLPSDRPGCFFGGVGCVDLAAGADGTLAALWQQGQANPAVAASVRSPVGDWGPAEVAGGPGDGDAFPHAAFTEDGTVVAVWVAGNVARASWRAEDGSWAPTDLGTPATGAVFVEHQDVVADDEGNAVTAWRDPAGVQASGFDGVGPRFTTFGVPSAGSIGQALSFTAAADDAWSSPTAISWSFGDGTGGSGGAVSHAYAAPGAFTATATAADAIGNASTRSGSVSVPTPPVAGCGSADVDRDGFGDACDSSDGSLPPVPFETVSVRVLSGDVFVKLPAAGAARAAQGAPAPKGFVRLQGAATIPVGATLDTSRGRILLRSAADTRRRVQSGQFFDGVFRIRQLRKPRGKARRRPTGLITELRLSGASFAGCGAQASARSKRRVRRLWGDGKGSFRTTGRHAAATVRGTRWLVEDRCDGTLVRVRRGRVEVRDLRRGRTVLVRAGHSYLARPR